MIELNNINVISIRGQGNIIVMCNNTGGVSCNNCSDVVIEGITWDKCGNPQIRNLYRGINFHTISNLTIQIVFFNIQKFEHCLYLLFQVLYIQIMNSCFIHNANTDIITCGLVAKTGYKHCVTENYVATGGMLIKEAISGTVIMIHIKHCIFNYNSHFGKIIDLKRKELPSGYNEIADGAGLTVEVRTSNFNGSILIENTNFSNNRGRSGAGTRLYVKHSPNKVILKKLNYYNNSGIRFYVSASALMIHLRKPKVITPTSPKQIQIFLLHCAFYNNYGARNTLDYVNNDVVQSSVMIQHCIFANNSDYGVTIVELNLQSQSIINIVGLNFSSNTGRGAMIHTHT